jgi:hypothetical protein
LLLAIAEVLVVFTVGATLGEVGVETGLDVSSGAGGISPGCLMDSATKVMRPSCLMRCHATSGGRAQEARESVAAAKATGDDLQMAWEIVMSVIIFRFESKICFYPQKCKDSF